MKTFRNTKMMLAFAWATALSFGMSNVLAQQTDENWKMPRTIDGQPDLQGVWANNTLTPVERPEVFGDKEFLTEEDMVFLNRRIAEITAEGGDALFGDGVLAAAFSGEGKSYDPSTGNYDQAWLPARSVHNRTSQIIDPPNGKFPDRTQEAIAAGQQLVSLLTESPADSWEDRPLSERCISYGSPYLGSGYNSYWQIVQSRDYVTVIQEMIHDVRVIPLDGRPHIDEDIKLWHGDSRGWWEDDTLVVETKNYSEESDYGPNSVAKINVERFTRISDTALEYEITSIDPGSYVKPYTRQIVFDHSPEPIYEYACHEGNYGLGYILSGARADERRAKEAMADKK